MTDLLGSGFRGMKKEDWTRLLDRECSLPSGLCPLALLFYIVDRNATGRLVWLPCWAVARGAKALRGRRNLGPALNGQAGKEDEVLSKEAGDRMSETLFSVCDGWYRSSV